MWNELGLRIKKEISGIITELLQKLSLKDFDFYKYIESTDVGWNLFEWPNLNF